MEIDKYVYIVRQYGRYRKLKVLDKFKVQLNSFSLNFSKFGKQEKLEFVFQCERDDLENFKYEVVRMEVFRWVRVFLCFVLLIDQMKFICIMKGSKVFNLKIILILIIFMDIWSDVYLNVWVFFGLVELIQNISCFNFYKND